MQKILFIFIIVFASLLFSFANAETQNNPPAALLKKDNFSRLWNLQDADILSVINEVSLETGKNFVIDPRVSGKITLISSKPIKPHEVYDLFLSVLGILGFSAIPNGNVIKIVPNAESSEFPTRVANQMTPGHGDEVVVRIIPLEHVSAGQLIPIIRPLLPQWSNVSVYAPGNVLILLGRASNLNRIVNVIQEIDHKSDNEIEMVHLHQASALQLATVLNNLQNAGRATGEVPEVTITADERSNSILLSGNKTARMHTRFLIAKLDTSAKGTEGNTEVVYLRYLQAKTFAPLLGKIAQNMLGKNIEKEKEETGPMIATINTNSSYRPQVVSAKLPPENLTNIQAEPSTNALIITAPPAMMKALNAVVAKLDIRPAQVLIEAVIVELDEGDLRNLGIQWGTLIQPDTNNVTSGAITDFPPLGAGIFGIIPGTDIRAVLSFLENKTGVNILSKPSVVVLDNQKAVLEVGKQVPFQIGSYATSNNATTVTPFNTFDYKKVALTLNVTPQINLGCAVRLKITVTNDTLQNPENPGVTPLINTSKIDNSVIINSNDVLVLGGLITNDITENVNKVPFLGDVPLIGKYIFQQKERKVEKKNLLVFIKPVILRNDVDAEAITYNKYQSARETEINWPADLTRPGIQKLDMILPPWKKDKALPKPFEQ